MNVDFHLSPEVEEEVLVETEAENSKSIVLYNDNHNTFDWVIN